MQEFLRVIHAHTLSLKCNQWNRKKLFQIIQKDFTVYSEQSQEQQKSNDDFNEPKFEADNSVQ